MKLEKGVDQYPLPAHDSILRVVVDFRTKLDPEAPCYPLVKTNVLSIKAARKQDDRKVADPVYWVEDMGALHIEPMPRRAGVIQVHYLPPEQVA